MPEITINEKIWKYEGKPLKAMVLEDSDTWAGRGNFYLSGEESHPVQLKDLDDCMGWMKRWAACSDYRAGYVLDFETGTVYYDEDAALTQVRDRIIPKNNLKNHFTNFVQRSFK